ncbi:hypothetical protein ACBR40_06505 [Nonomuraea sp. AD125B]|uniref:hypothetical protein n=1 Tax=Nonomuraea TaxID=83681 RepID=UPI00352785C1
MSGIESLREEEAVRVLQHLLTAFDEEEEPATTPQEVRDRLERDRAYVRDLAAALEVQPGAQPPSARELLAELAELPDVAPEVERAIEQVRRRSTLPVDAETLAAVVGVAAAVAIIRPRVEFRKQEKKDEKDLKVVVDVRGMANLGRVLQMLLDLLGK